MKLSQFLSEEELEPFDEEFDQGMLLDTILGLYDLLPEDVDLPEDLAVNMGEIFQEFDDFEDDEEDLEEGFKPKRVKRDRQQRRKNRQYYKKNRFKIKMQKKKYQRTPAFKKYLRKKKRLGKVGKTSTGKRKTKFI